LNASSVISEFPFVSTVKVIGIQSPLSVGSGLFVPFGTSIIIEFVSVDGTGI